MQGRVSFEEVTFTYPTRCTAALHSVSLSVNPGEVGRPYMTMFDSVCRDHDERRLESCLSERRCLPL
jgi:hypothetical protein